MLKHKLSLLAYKKKALSLSLAILAALALVAFNESGYHRCRK
jgi:hypothetical protein